MTREPLRWGLLAVVLVASSVVVWAAFNPVPHTGGDNAGYVSLAYGLLTTGSYTEVFDPQGLPHTKYPPVFPALLALLISLGARTWVALKSTAVVSTILSVGLAYLWAERRLGPLPAAAVALLLATSSAMVYYSHWVLSDPLFLTLTLASLYALERAGEVAAPEDGEKRPAGGGPPYAAWMGMGVTAAGLAYFTRQAGLPLIVALLAWLAWTRRWRSLAVSAVALGVPMIAWWLRGRGEGVAQYASEFWLVDPYDPGAGSIAVADLVPRLFENLSAYVLRHGPGGVVGQGGPSLAELGILLALVGVAGWVLTLRRRIGLAELYFPLYSGLILLWPPVWGGDRFALPLYPLVFVYGAVALASATARLPALARNAVALGALLVLLLPAGGAWLEAGRQSRACAVVARENGSWSCYGPRVAWFTVAASWTREGLPPGSAVLSRKPRHYFLLSGTPSRTFPFEEDPQAHLALADDLGARYVLLDQWDGQAARFVGSAVRAMPEAYCYVQAFGPPAEGGSQLLGVLDAEDRVAERPTADEGVALDPCPVEYSNQVGEPATFYDSSGRIPLLERLDS